MDGTLVDTERLWDVSLAELAVSLGGDLSAGTRAAMVGADMATTMRIMFAELGLTPRPAAMAAATDELVRRTGELFGSEVRWLPGAREALTTLHTAGLPMALVTSTPRALTELALDSIGRHYFAATVCGDEVEHTKPHPEPYLRACALLGVAATGCVAIEDSPSGAASAEAAGTVVVVVAGDVEVPAGRRRVLVESLTGIGAELLRPGAAGPLNLTRSPLGSPLGRTGGSM